MKRARGSTGSREYQEYWQERLNSLADADKEYQDEILQGSKLMKE
jgi:hypothetical protein